MCCSPTPQENSIRFRNTFFSLFAGLCSAFPTPTDIAQNRNCFRGECRKKPRGQKCTRIYLPGQGHLKYRPIKEGMFCNKLGHSLESRHTSECSSPPPTPLQLLPHPPVLTLCLLHPRLSPTHSPSSSIPTQHYKAWVIWP